MQKWEYNYEYIMYIQEKNEFTSSFLKPSVWGLVSILDNYGERGWELVNLVPDLTRGQFVFSSRSGDGAFGGNVLNYRAVFKRPLP